MRKVLLALSGVAVALTTAPAASKTYVCTRWQDGVCVTQKRVKGRPPYQVGYVFGPDYAYTSVTDIPAPVVSYYHLGTDRRYVYDNGYIYVIDPANNAVVRVIDTYAH
jgi:hypothetical protein